MQTLSAPLALEWTVATASLIGGVLISVVGLGYGMTSSEGVGAGFFPVVAGSLMGIAGVMWIFQLIRAKQISLVGLQQPDGESSSALASLLEDDNSDEGEDADFPDRHGWVRVGIVFGSILLAALLLPLLGYTIVMTLQLGLVLRLVSKRKMWIAAVVAVGASLISRFVFEVLLGTALPNSSIDFLSGLGL